jgi:glyoxylase I family protein
MIVGLHHVAVSVPDIEAATRFYCDVLGFRPAFTGGWDDKPVNDRVIGIDRTAAKVTMLRAANAYVELWEYRNPVPAPQDAAYSPADHGYAHIGLQVTDIHAEFDRLRDAGMTFHGPPVALGGGSAAIYGRDPWGNIIELYEIVGPHTIPGTDPVALRLRELEDVEAIRRLKAAYGKACDADHDGDAVCALFVPDGVWATTMNQRCEGHAAIREHFGRIRASGRMIHSTHMFTNPVIDVRGDEATGTWSFIMMFTAPDQARFRIVGFYDEEYVRVDGRWMFRSLLSRVQDYCRMDALDVLPR